ncbi:MAG: HAMP domain-containing sensor histidine kinase [Desulforhopalus sp.]
MFLKLSRDDFSWSRSKRALPVFLLLWGGGLLLGLLYLFSIRAHLQAIEREQAEILLDTYLAANRSSNSLSGSFYQQQETLLKGLVFIRITQGNDQIMVVGDQAGALNFKGLMNFPPESTGVWLPVGAGEEQRLLTVVVRKYENGVLVQAGKDGREGYTLFNQLIRYTIFIVASSIVLLWPLSLYFIKVSLSPLVSTREKIVDLIQRSKTGLLPEMGSGPELDSLYSQINQLIRQNRHLVSEMQHSLDNVAHDLRTPMTRLRSVAEYGLQAEDDTLRLRDALSDCLEESERVLAMLKIMMSVAEAESGTMRLELEDCDLVSTLKQVVTLYEYVAEEHDITVHLQTDIQVAAAYVDKTRISQVWANLLDNGIKYGKEGGWVKIEARSTGEDVVVSFTDNGMGISESEQDRIWERLYRGDRSRSRKGLGLGLSYVHAVVAAHHGTVSVASTLHQGSRFEVCLPRGQVSMQEKSQISGE